MDLNELLEKIKQQYVIKGEELDNCQRLVGELKTEVKQLKNELLRREEKIVQLNSKWGKAEKLFGKIKED